MKQSRSCRGILPFPNFTLYFFISCFLLVLSSPGTYAWKNYTVGGSLGWYDIMQEPKVNYQKWADGNNFSLGDFLIFNTDKNHSVVQTYNATTYRLCNDVDDDKVVEWSAGEPEFSKVPVTVAVPLLKEGTTYFFSGYYDGEQCQNGQHFMINVTHGQGLPESLKSPSEAAPAPNSADYVNDVPDTVIPSNFNNPNDTAAVQPSTGAGEALARLLRREAGVLNLALVVLGAMLVFG
ncbi:early nodulin-like protein 18 [Typha latifolia]|uniref:early nodulin-like protein 18 n=1 Tax=Typha latifolia TaxID=4733 RepID=UPI003C2FE773